MIRSILTAQSVLQIIQCEVYIKQMLVWSFWVSISCLQ